MAHEDLTREERVEGSSDRVFGLVFSGVFFLIALWPLFHGETLRWWSSGVAAIFALIAFAKPALLTELNRLWIKLGALLGKIISPIALGVLFFGIFSPLGVVMRLIGNDPLRLRRDPDAASYWIPRDPPGPPPDSMTNQF